MGLVLSGGPIIFDIIDPVATVTNFISKFSDIVAAAGWGARVSVSGGFKWALTSPQGLKCKCFIQTIPGNTDALLIYFTSNDEAIVGFKHVLYITATSFPDQKYQIWCNPCQIFISVPGKVAPVTHCNFQGGIPFTLPSATQAWWTNISFRHKYEADLEWCACYNGNLLTIDRPTASKSNLRLSSLRIAIGTENENPDTVQRSRFYGASGVDYYSDGALYVEPYVTWGSYPNIEDAAFKRGQLYDAVLPTLDRPLDIVHFFNDLTLGQLTFFNFMHDPTTDHATRLGCLYLLTGVTAIFSRGAYVY